MPWQTPTLAQVRRLVRDDIASALPGADATIPNSVLRVLADANAGLAALTLQYIDWLSQQFLPDTAEREWLERHGQIWLGGRKAATYAIGSVFLGGIAETVVPAGTRLVGGSGIEFETTDDIVLGASDTEAPIIALRPGASGNLDAGSSLAISTAIPGLNGSGMVVELAGGTNPESDDSLRERVLDRIRKPPMGGDADDYVAWARALPGVTRAWCAPNEMGPGTVTVRVMLDELRANIGGYPTADDLAAIKVAMDLVRPVALKDFFVESPIPEPVNLTITDLDADTTTTRAGIEAAVRAMIRDRGAPAHAVGGVLRPAQTIHREWVSAAILSVPGVESFDLEMDDHVMPTNASMAVLGSIY